MRAPAIASAFATTMLVLSACDVPTPSVVVRFADPASADDAVRVEVSLLASCTGQVLGEPASAAITTVELTPTRSQPLGTFDRGDYGLYGRAFDASCTIVAAGCDTVTLGDDDPLEVTLASIAGAGCDAGEGCARDGRCVSSDGGS